MENKQLVLLQKHVEILSREVGSFIRGELNIVEHSDIHEKDINSLVSYVDETAEKTIVNSLQSQVEGAGFITEENTVNQGRKEYTWIIDPLDGTSNFLNKIPHFSISIALQHKEQLLLGVVYDIMRDTCFSAIKGGGLFVNGLPKQIGQVTTLDQAMVVTGFPYEKDSIFEASFSILKYFLKNARGFRRLGSAALDLAYVAAGRLDVYYESNLNAWDVAAGVLLVQEAGGEVHDFQNQDNMLNNGEIIASNKHLMPSVLDVINRFR